MNSPNGKTTAKGNLPCLFQQRVEAGLLKLKTGNSMPLPTHIFNRRYILDSAADAARSVASVQKRAWKTAKKNLETLLAELEPRNAEIRSSLPQRVCDMWGEANLALIEHVIRKADPKNGQAVADFIIQGVPIFGELPKTCLFEELSEAEIKKFQEKQQKAVEKFALKEKAEIPKWASREQLEEAHATFLKKAKNPTEHKLPFSQLKTPVYCFPVAQGDRSWDKSQSRWVYSKIRPCMDFRYWNGFNVVDNKISYAGPEMVTRCCLEFLGLDADFRLMSRKQVFANVEDERKNEQKQPSRPARPPLEKPRPFAVAKTDFTNYY